MVPETTNSSALFDRHRTVKWLKTTMTQEPKLTDLEFTLLRNVVIAIAKRQFSGLLNMPNVDCNESNISSIVSTMEDCGSTAYAVPDENFADRIDVVEFNDRRGLSAEVELLAADGDGDQSDYIILVFEVLRDGPKSRIGVHYAYY